MAGLSATLFDARSIEIVGGHSAAAISGSDGTGRALSDVGHTTGLWVAEVEVTQYRSGGTAYWGCGVLSDTANLNVGLGAGPDPGYYFGFFGSIQRYLNASFSGGGTGLAQFDSLPGLRIRFVVDAATRKVWIGGHRVTGMGTYAQGSGQPSLGTGEHWIVPGSGPLRIALRPANGSASNRNVLRLCSRHHELTSFERDGAQPWDARQITISGTVNSDHAPVGSQLRVAWFDHPSPHEITTAPTSVTTITVGAGGAYSVTIWTSLDPGQPGSLLLMRDDGTVVQARSHYRPVTVS